MGKIYCVMGKSATGKDTIYHELLKREDLGLNRIVPYTTRPIRPGETEGIEYHFVDETEVEALAAAGRIVELRSYDTVYGVWKYFTVNDANLNLEEKNYLYIVTLEGYLKIRDYYKKDRVVPIYIQVDDGDRLIRAIERERGQGRPQYEEMCRRFLADAGDFAEERLQEAGIAKRFENRNLEETIAEIAAYIEEDYEGK